MNEKQALVPRLRFPEFREAGEWEQKIIEDFFEVGSSKRVLQQDWTTRGVPFYRTRELVSLSKNEPFGSEIFISEELFYEVSEKYGTPAEGDFLVSGVGTLGICYPVQSRDRFYFKDGNVLWFKLKGGIIPSFFQHAFQADEIQNQILGQASISTVGTYTIQNAKATKITLPQKIEEQQKIADCLSSLDALIVAQAEKIDALKTHKNGLMQQLFPREGETVPRLRFPEFRNAGEWRYMKAGLLFANRIEQGQDGLPIYSVTMNDGMAKRDSLERKIENISKSSGNKKAHKHDIIYNMMRMWQGASGVAFEDCMVSPAYVVLAPRDSISSAFFGYLFKTHQFLHILTAHSQGLTKDRLRLYFKDFAQIPLPSPPVEEQKIIADCLSSLDALIAAHTEKLDALKTHKKGLMQQLFPVVEETQP